MLEKYTSIQHRKYLTLIKKYWKYYQYIKTINGGQCKGSTYRISSNKLKNILESGNYHKGLMGKMMYDNIIIKEIDLQEVYCFNKIIQWPIIKERKFIWTWKIYQTRQIEWHIIPKVNKRMTISQNSSKLYTNVRNYLSVLIGTNNKWAYND